MLVRIIKERNLTSKWRPLVKFLIPAFLDAVPGKYFEVLRTLNLIYVWPLSRHYSRLNLLTWCWKQHNLSDVLDRLFKDYFASVLLVYQALQFSANVQSLTSQSTYNMLHLKWDFPNNWVIIKLTTTDKKIHENWLDLCKMGFICLWFLWLKMWCQTGRRSIALCIRCLYW